MAYEDFTYEVIYQRMMDRVRAKYPNLDRREGSISSNALMSAALELAVAYTELENTRNESFVKTASRDSLYLACEQIGMDTTRFNASSGVHKGVFDVEVPMGSQWNCELYNYTVTEYLGKEDGYFAYRMECDTVGTTPNNQTGTLTPITDIPSNLAYAQLVECLVEGENETSDDDIRTSYFNFVTNADTGGNVAQYKRWCEEYQGVGNYKIMPLWNGANTVKVSVLSASNRAASDELVQEMQNYFDPNVTGMGDGVAPCGAFVTVSTATERPMNITATVTLKEGYKDGSLIDEALTNFFSSIAYQKGIVAYMNVGAAIINADCVESIANLTVNDGTSDIVLGAEEIAVLGVTSWVVA